MQRILVIQTAFIGDVVLATGLLETLHLEYPEAKLDLLVRKGNEALFVGHPFLKEVLIWDKRLSKYKHLFQVLQKIRSKKYDLIVNLQRFAATGFLTAFSNAKRTIGFDKNPFSIFFTDKVKHVISDGTRAMHEIERNQELIHSVTSLPVSKPKLYPGKNDYKEIAKWLVPDFICIAPASVWFTKQFPSDQWTELINAISEYTTIYLLGAPSDHSLCDLIQQNSSHKKVVNLAGKLNFLQSAALMKNALMNYVNDSAPMHFASSVNAPVTAVYCSTIPDFGFGPLSDDRHIVEVIEPLSCRPCGLHGKKACPLGHFNCARMITTQQLLDVLPK